MVPITETLDQRPVGYCALTGDTLDAAVRTLYTRRQLFAMLVMSRGLSDELTQTSWRQLCESIDDLITLGER